MDSDKETPIKAKKIMPVSPGRPKGVPNKLSRIAKDTIAQVFEDIGGIDRMAEWAQESPGAFYQIYAKLLPLQVSGVDGGAPINMNWQIEFVKPRNEG